jgi:hypothetical protein
MLFAHLNVNAPNYCDPDEWDLPPKPKWMRWHTYNRYVEQS